MLKSSSGLKYKFSYCSNVVPTETPILETLYPNGIQPEQYLDLLAIVRVIDKLFRVANKKDAFGESPWRDICGYAILGVANDMEKEKKNT